MALDIEGRTDSLNDEEDTLQILYDIRVCCVFANSMTVSFDCWFSGLGMFNSGRSRGRLGRFGYRRFCRCRIGENPRKDDDRCWPSIVDSTWKKNKSFTRLFRDTMCNSSAISVRIKWGLHFRPFRSNHRFRLQVSIRCVFQNPSNGSQSKWNPNLAQVCRNSVQRPSCFSSTWPPWSVCLVWAETTATMMERIFESIAKMNEHHPLKNQMFLDEGVFKFLLRVILGPRWPRWHTVPCAANKQSQSCALSAEVTFSVQMCRWEPWNAKINRIARKIVGFSMLASTPGHPWKLHTWSHEPLEPACSTCQLNKRGQRNKCDRESLSFVNHHYFKCKIPTAQYYVHPLLENNKRTVVHRSFLPKWKDLGKRHTKRCHVLSNASLRSEDQDCLSSIEISGLGMHSWNQKSGMTLIQIFGL